MAAPCDEDPAISDYHSNYHSEELKSILRAAVRENRGFLLEHESKRILEEIGIKTTGFLIARSENEAVSLSEEIGYPVVLKIASPDVVHKSDSGGVKLNLADADQVRKAYRQIIGSARGAKITGVTVQRMAAPGQEAIIGVTRDPIFGPIIMFGLGGIFVEVLKDVSFRILPITEKDAAEMIEEIRGYAVLQGIRGHAVDISALKEVLLKVSRLVMETPRITEMDLNPLFLYPQGYCAVDARMFLGEPHNAEDETFKKEGTLRDFFYPRSIAVLGATDAEGKLGYNVFNNLVGHHFPGKLYPINPRKDSVLGYKAYRSVLDVPEQVDLAIIIVPAKGAVSAIEDCCRKGVRYIVVETAGFAESGEEGKQAQAKIEQIIREKGCRLLGPNCSGVINTHHNMVQSIGPLDELRKGNVGMIAQAGVYASGILIGLRNVLDFGIVATIGNKMDISETDILEYLIHDDNIDVIVMYMEDIRSGKRFVEVAARAAAIKPVIVLKSGRTEAGKKAVSSHTASLAGNDEVNNAAFKQSGVIRARDNEHLFALTRGFSKQPLPKGNGIMVITYTGSLGVAATDMLYLRKMHLSQFDPAIRERLEKVLPDYANVTNPVDCSFTMTPEQVKNLIEIGTDCRDVHGFIVIIQGEMLGSFVEMMKAIDYKGKPVVACVACKEFMMHDVVKMERAGIPVYSTAETAAEVLAEMYHYGVRRRNTIADSIGRYLSQDTFSVDNVPVRLRLINADDIGLWTDFVNGCSEKSLWLRFLSPFNATPERAERFCNIDPEEEIAVVAEMTTADRSKFLGIARLIKNKLREGEVEYALIISDPWQKKKLGHVLSEQIIELCKREGFKKIRSETLQENYAMIRIFNKCDFQFEGKDENMLAMALDLT